MNRTQRMLILMLSLFSNTIFSYTPKRYWVHGNFLYWKFKESPLDVPLVTLASSIDSIPGALGQPHTKVILGGCNIKNHYQNGFLVSIGSWLDIDQTIGLQGIYFLLPKRASQRKIHTSGEPGSINVAVPIFDTSGIWGLAGVPGETIFILPGPLDNQPGFAGAFKVRSTNKLEGLELHAMKLIFQLCDAEANLLIGPRWLRLQESLKFSGKTETVPDFPFQPGFYNFADQFKTQNNFVGITCGLQLRYKYNCWSLDATAKIGFGAMIQNRTICGRSRTSGGNLFFLTNNTSNDILDTGIFTQKTNIGNFKQSRFCIVEDFMLAIGYDINELLHLHVGYSILWVNRVIRPGTIIDRRINSTQTGLADLSRSTVGIGTGPINFGVPGKAPLPSGLCAPKIIGKNSDFFAHGLVLGAMVEF